MVPHLHAAEEQGERGVSRCCDEMERAPMKPFLALFPGFSTRNQVPAPSAPRISAAPGAAAQQMKGAVPGESQRESRSVFSGLVQSYRGAAGGGAIPARSRPAPSGGTRWRQSPEAPAPGRLFPWGIWGAGREKGGINWCVVSFADVWVSLVTLNGSLVDFCSQVHHSFL